MHPTAFSNCQDFFNVYGNFFGSNTNVVEIGSYDANGSLKSLVPSNFNYVGVDFCEGKGVDIVLTDPYVLPFENESVDIVLSSSVFEHSEFFWVVFLEIMRVLKPTGLFYLNAPSNGPFHKYPVDCWRFYPDSGNALAKWANRNNVNAVMLESFTSTQNFDVWNDFIAVFSKDVAFTNRFSNRILQNKINITNGLVNGFDSPQLNILRDAEGYINKMPIPEDMLKNRGIFKIILNKIRHRLKFSPIY